MMETEFLLDRQLSNNELEVLLATAFGINAGDILIFNEGDWPTSVSDNIRLICDAHHKGGEFSRYVSLYLQDYSLEPLNDNKLIPRICGIAHCRALISDDSVNPYSWILVDSSDNRQPVLIECDSEWNEINIYRRYAPPSNSS